MTATPLDAAPDIPDVQVIVSTEWMGRRLNVTKRQTQEFLSSSGLIAAPFWPYFGARCSLQSSQKIV